MAIFVNDSCSSGQQSFGFACRRSGSSGYSNSSIKVTAESGGLKVNTPYNANFVALLKEQIPATGRKWDASSKAWYVSREHAALLKTLIDQTYGCDVQMPTVIAATPEIFEIEFQADYIANCKNEAASVHAEGSWSAKIPEKVLRKWFKQSEKNSPATLYGLLGVDQSASPVEIKKAYKRAARQWHPDICREPEARFMFEKCKEAYDTLNDPLLRNRYNAGLMFEAMAKTSRHSRAFAPTKYASFTPLLRCGVLKVRATRELGQLVVHEILEWRDIENEYGQTMVSFWAGDSFSVMWV
jgi:DnaJ-domain-containing protein 1